MASSPVAEAICSPPFARAATTEDWPDICELIDRLLLRRFDFLLDLLMLSTGVKLLGETGPMRDVTRETRDPLRERNPWWPLEARSWWYDAREPDRSRPSCASDMARWDTEGGELLRLFAGLSTSPSSCIEIRSLSSIIRVRIVE